MEPGDAIGMRESWRRMVEFYEFFASSSSSGRAVAVGMLPVVRKLADTEVAGTFRAGQSLTTLMVSTAKYHGLKPEDAFATLYFGPDSLFWLSYKPPGIDAREQEWKCSAVEVEARFRQVLERLKADTEA